MVQEVLSEMEVFSPVGSNILNKSGVNYKSSKIWATEMRHPILQLIETEPAMMYDAVHVFARGLEAASVEGPELKIR